MLNFRGKVWTIPFTSTGILTTEPFIPSCGLIANDCKGLICMKLMYSATIRSSKSLSIVPHSGTSRNRDMFDIESGGTLPFNVVITCLTHFITTTVDLYVWVQVCCFSSKILNRR